MKRIHTYRKEWNIFQHICQPDIKVKILMGMALLMTFFLIINFVIMYNYLNVNQKNFLHKELDYLAGLHAAPIVQAIEKKKLYKITSLASTLQRAALIDGIEIRDHNGHFNLNLGNLSYDASTIYKTLYSKQNKPIATMVLYPAEHHMLGLFTKSIKSSMPVILFSFALIILLVYAILDMSHVSLQHFIQRGLQNLQQPKNAFAAPQKKPASEII